MFVVTTARREQDASQSLLASCGAEVRFAASTRHALDILDLWRPALIVSDIVMPEQDAYALIRQVRERTRAWGGKISAIALTAAS